jgi:hypothetical protein
MAMYRRDRGAKVGLGIRIQSQCNNQSLSGIAVRVRGVAFELLDPVHTQTSALGKLLLRQTGSLSMTAKQFAKRASRGCEHRRRQTTTELSNPPACTPAWE